MDALKNRYFLPALLLCCFAKALCQQPNAVNLRQRIVFSTTSIRLDSMLKKVSQQTPMIFSYNPRKVNRHLLFHFPSGSMTVEAILQAIKEKTGLDYAVAENHIILKQAKSPAPPAVVNKANSKTEGVPPVKKSGTIPLPEPSKAKKDSSVATIIKADSSENIVKTMEETVTQESLQSTASPNVTPEPVIPKEKQKVKTDSTVKASIQKKEKPVETKSPTIKNTRQPFQFKAELSADETLYIGPALQIGVPLLYGTVAYKTDFKTGLLSYGAGTSVKLNDQWRMNLFFNMGDVSKSSTYSFQSKQDSSKTVDSVYSVKSRLTRAGITLEKKFKGNFSIQLGLQYNVLTSTYTINGDSPGSNLTNVATTKSFQAIQPPYSFSSDLTVKDWIGVQLSLLYILPFSQHR
jgi:hypothetical protein